MFWFNIILHLHQFDLLYIDLFSYRLHYHLCSFHINHIVCIFVYIFLYICCLLQHTVATGAACSGCSLLGGWPGVAR